jgi:hypothetical protein
MHWALIRGYSCVPNFELLDMFSFVAPHTFRLW